MSVAGFTDVALDIFGGIVTDMKPSDLPLGVSPDCQDVAFTAGAVRTRPGLLSVFPPIAGNPTVNYLKTYITPAQAERLLALDSNGVLWKEASPDTLSQIGSNLPSGCRAKSTTIFGREYVATSDGKFGLGMPLQYDDTNLDRVSQDGPGAGPSVTEAAVEPTLIVATSPTGAVRNNNIATISTSTAHGYQVGQTVLIAGGVIDASFGGSYLISSVPTSTTFTYANPGATMTSGGDGTTTGGSATLQPQVSPGIHQVSVIFETRQGYLTAPSAPVNWSTGGGRRGAITNIPVGPANVIARILAFTGANGASFFYVGSNVPQSTAMRIADNTTTSWTVDFSDAALLAGTSVDGLFSQVVLGACTGAIDYSSRVFWWGERNRVDNFVNLSFDGGFDPTASRPLGWIADPTYGSGGAEENSIVNWGFAYRISGPAPTGPTLRGMITQSAFQDSDGGADSRAVDKLLGSAPRGKGFFARAVQLDGRDLQRIARATCSRDSQQYSVGGKLSGVYGAFQRSDACSNSRRCDVACVRRLSRSTRARRIYLRGRHRDFSNRAAVQRIASARKRRRESGKLRRANWSAQRRRIKRPGRARGVQVARTTIFREGTLTVCDAGRRDQRA